MKAGQEIIKEVILTVYDTLIKISEKIGYMIFTPPEMDTLIMECKVGGLFAQSRVLQVCKQPIKYEFTHPIDTANKYFNYYLRELI